MKARILAAIFAAVLLAGPIYFSTGWAPVLLVWPAAFLAAFAVFGAD